MIQRVITLAAILLLTLVTSHTVRGLNDVRKPPILQEPPSSKSEFRAQGDHVTWQCKADGIPAPTYDWKRDKKPVPPGSDITVNKQTGVLDIKSLTTQVEGVYTCEATVNFGPTSAVAKSPEIEIRVARIEDWIKKDIDPVIKDEWDYAVLTCDDIPRHYGHTSFVWQKVVDDDMQPVTLADRMFIDAKGNLHFTYLLGGDTLSANSAYSCGLSSGVAGNMKRGSRLELQVRPVDSIPSRNPSLRFHTGTGTQGYKDLTFMRGSKGHLECVFSGYIPGNANKLPTVEWFEGQYQITDGQGRYRILDNGRVLTIDSLEEADEKSYVCRAKENRIQASMNLNVTSAPIFVTPLMAHQSVIQGGDVVFRCVSRSASGELPPGEPLWERNGQRLDATYDVSKFAFEDGKTRLIVKDVSKETDIACFQCYVSNSVGTSTASACLNVVLPIEILTRPDPEQTIKAGDILDLSVSARSDPLFNLTYQWHFKGQTYGAAKAPPYVTYDVITKVATINTTGFSDEQMRNISGLYNRTVYNDVQTVTVETKVVFKEQLVVEPATAGGFNFWIIIIIIIVLIILVLIIIICCVVCRRKMQEGAYPVDKKETAAGLDPAKELKDSGFHDLSRADYDWYYPGKPAPVIGLDDLPARDDESFGSAEYGEDIMAFTENGSFIGVYTQNEPDTAPPPYHQTTESNV